MSTVFSLSSVLVMPFWLLMVFAPRWTGTQRLMRSVWVIAPAALLYSVLVLPSLLVLLPTLANPNLAGLMQFLSSENGATIAWVHFLAFDLFVGRYVYFENLEHKVNPFLNGVVLFWVLMFGPFGFLLHLGLSFWQSKQTVTAG